MPAPRWPKYTWDANARQYRGGDGKFVSRKVVRQALDETIESAKADITQVSRQLQLGRISLIDWQLQMEKSVKTIHVMSAAVAAGGMGSSNSRRLVGRSQPNQRAVRLAGAIRQADRERAAA